MLPPIHFLFPYRIRNLFNRCRISSALIVLLILVFTLSTVYPSHAQQITFNSQDPSIYYPFFFIHCNSPFYDFLLQNNHDWYSQHTMISNIFWPVRLLSSEPLFSISYPDAYHNTLFLPPPIYIHYEYPHEYSWFLPFMQENLSLQYPEQVQDIQDDIDQFLEKYNIVLDEAENLTYPDLVQKYPEGQYTPDLGYTISETNFYDLVKNAIGLSSAEEEKINENGFVVSNRMSYQSFGDAYLDFFYKDLPVFISTDSILQALHRSYDGILEEIEEKILMDQLESILSSAQETLPALIQEPSGILADTYHDLNVFYTVARKLLGRYGHPLPFEDDSQVQSILNSINRLSFEWVDLFGKSRMEDFSQFKPRGHYTRSEAFEKYFRAMMWLGRIDFRIEENGDLDLRQLLGAYLIWRSVEEGGVRSAWDDMDQVIELMVGEPDAMNLRTISMLMEDAGVQSTQDLLDPEIQSKVLQIMQEKGYGNQRICSHYLGSDPFDPHVQPMPKTFAFMGQRFTVDSHVFSNVVYDRIVVNGVKIQRLMPDPLDAMFVIGNNRALNHLKGELNKWNYQGNLFILRYLLDQYDRGFWESNMYNGWMDALRSLSNPCKGEGYPATMKTPAYRDKLLHTQLASWSELRHNTILYVKQSLTGVIFCEYPDGYVEAIPDFYNKLKGGSDRAKEIFTNIHIPGNLKAQYISHFENFSDTMGMLEILAQKQLDGQPRTEEEIQFIKNTIKKTVYGGGCSPIKTYYTGWYPKLFYRDPEYCAEPDFIVADVHTNPNGPPLGNYDILHVGVGKINVIYFTAETCAGPTLYVGPVFSYYERIEENMRRLNDEEWSLLVRFGAFSAPAWTNSFLIEDALTWRSPFYYN